MRQGVYFLTSICFLFFFEVFTRKKQMVCSLVSIYLIRSQLSMQWKQTTQNFRLLIQRYNKFWFSRETPGNSFSTAFYVWISHKKLLMIYSFKRQNFIVMLSFLLEILNKMCIAIVYLSFCDTINFKIDIIFLLKLCYT